MVYIYTNSASAQPRHRARKRYGSGGVTGEIFKALEAYRARFLRLWGARGVIFEALEGSRARFLRLEAILEAPGAHLGPKVPKTTGNTTSFWDTMGGLWGTFWTLWVPL